MAIELAPMIKITQSKSSGHCGPRMHYAVEVHTKGMMFYPSTCAGYQNPADLGYDEAKRLADKMSEILDYEIEDLTYQPKSF